MARKSVTPKTEVSEAQTAVEIAQWLKSIEPAETSPLPIEDQANLYLLLWELSGHIKTLRKDCVYGEHLRTCDFARRAILNCFGALKLSDEAMKLAGKLKAEMPDDSRKAAISVCTGRTKRLEAANAERGI